MAIYNSREELLNTDWQSKINEATAAGNNVLAAQYEQARNDKIASKEYQDWGGQQTQTNNYTQHLPTNSSAYEAAYNAAKNNDWDAAGRAVNQIAIDEGVNKYGTYNMENANAYLNELANQFGYDAKTYYNQRYDEAYGAGSAAAYDATGGAIKTYADLVDKLGAGEAQKFISQYTANTTGGTKNAAVIPGISSATGGMSDMTKYLQDLYASNLEAELAALKNAYDSNVAELESQNDKIAEQYRAARNQTAAQNALEVQSMNERALATGLNTGASGQLALAQNMAYQNNLGNLWAQEAQQQAESDRLLAEMMRDYNAQVNQTTANINAQLSQALHNEMIRQQELAAAAEAARIKQEQEDREWAYMLEQDELDRQLAYAQLAAKNNGDSTTKGMSLSTAKAMAKAGQFTDEVISTLISNGYNEEYLVSEYGYVPPIAEPVGNAIPEGLIQSIGMNRTAVGQASAIKRALENQQITETQAANLLLEFGLV